LARPLRYTAILVLVAASAALAAFGGWRFARASAPVSGPVVLISIDALRADRLPVYGYTGGNTPAIDALAADGLVFERAYAHAPLTLPSHASLLSGRLPFDTGVRDNAGFVVDGRNRMLAEILRDRGYATGAVVSSFALRRATGIDQGFTFFDDDLSGAGRDAAAAEQVAERWLRSTETPRAFLFLHVFGPHRPRRASEAPDGNTYDGSVSEADKAIGRLVRYLKANQLYDQSTIILLSDHGEGLGDHGEDAHGLLVYDEALRVPLIIKPAASEEAGRRVPALVQLADIAPTVLDLAKAPVPGDLAGQSLTPLLAGDSALAARFVYSESMYPYYALGWSGLATVTDGRFRYIVPFPASPWNPSEAELYDHETDPREQTNLVGGNEPPALAALEAALVDFTSTAVMPGRTAVSAEDHERYESLGYVGSRRSAFETTALSRGDGRVVHPRDRTRLVNRWRDAMARALERDWSGALVSLEAALELEPAHADLWSEVALLSVAAGRHNDALAAVKELDALEPTSAVASYIEARALQARGRHQQAAAAFELALAGQEDPGARAIPEMRSAAAESWLRLYRYEEAEYLFVEEVKRFPANARAWAGLASLYAATERNDEAAAVLSELVHQLPTAEANEFAARVWTALGQPSQASAANAEARRLTAQ
jgi:arylsulfatase A-like enzyme